MRRGEAVIIQTPNQFVADTLLPDFPPAHPLRNPAWAGLAFDRNRYEDLAPAQVWDALFATHVRQGGPEKLLVISADDLGNGTAARVEPSRNAVMAYLQEDVRFLRDHYILSPRQDWLCRLDQDVTLIAGESGFLQEVVVACGGFSAVMDIMEDDFDPGPTDAAGLRRYLVELVRGLSRK